MKVLCPSCARVAAASSFRVDRDAVLITCGGCHAEHALVVERPPQVRATSSSPAPPMEAGRAEPPQRWVAPAVPSPAPAPTAKVVSLRPVNDAVRLAAHAATKADPFAVPEGHCPKCIAIRDADAQSCRQCGLVYVNFRAEETAPSAALSKAFLAALENWEEPSLHEQVFAVAVRGGELPAAGRLYRIRLAESPHDLVAQRARDEIVTRAATAADLLRTFEPRDGRPKWQWVAVGLIITAAAGSVLLLVRALMS